MICMTVPVNELISIKIVIYGLNMVLHTADPPAKAWEKYGKIEVV